MERLQEVLVYVDWVARRLGKGQAACTLSLAYVEKDSAWVASLGDSPVLLCSKERFQNQDLQWIVNKVKSSGLHDFVGMGQGLLESLSYSKFPIKKGDWLLVMSDGVAEAISDKEFENYFRKREFKNVARELCVLAEEHGATDDLSAITLAI